MEKAKVYFTKKIAPESLLALYEKMGVALPGKVAVKLSTGEAGNPNYLNPDLIKDLVQKVNGTIVECNTAYQGKRYCAQDHYKVAEDHGFTKIAPVDITDYLATTYNFTLPEMVDAAAGGRPESGAAPQPFFIIRFIPEKSREAGKKWTFRLYPGYVEKICGKVHKFRQESSTYSTMEFEKMVIAFLGAWC